MPKSPKEHKAQVAAVRRRSTRKRADMATNWAGRGFKKSKDVIVVQSPSTPRRRGRPPRSDMERALDRQLREIEAKNELIDSGELNGRIGEVVAYHNGPRFQRQWVRAVRKETDECATDSPVTLKCVRRMRSYGG